MKNIFEFLADEQKNTVVNDFNDTFTYYPDKTIVNLFEEQAEKTPYKIAVCFDDKELTYEELNKEANRFSNYLLNNYENIQDNPVGVKLEKSEKMIVAILGILKAGAFLIPIDPEYPKNRIEYIEKKSELKVIIDTVSLDRFYAEKENYSLDNLPERTTEKSLAYVIFTSGSTGDPKGVQIDHGNLSNYILSLFDIYHLSDENILFSSSISFDASVEQIFLSLLSSSSLHIIKKENIIHEQKLIDYIKTNTITHVHGVPSFLENINFSSCNSLKRIISGGERLTVSNISKSEKTALFNKYGPTECTISSTIYQCEDNLALIGKPLANAKVYILDKNLSSVAMGAIGNIYIAGKGVSRGYLNDDQLTSKLFIESPFEENEIIYNTGDLGRYYPDGNIEYIGREDNQVKISGHRVELEDVEKNIEQAFNIKKVICRVDNDNLIAYYENTEDIINVHDLKNSLKDVLPYYMIPSQIISIEAFPLNRNGKIDRNLLKNISSEKNKQDKTVQESDEGYIDENVVEIWKKILKKETIGSQDNFFEIGGNSIKAMRAVALDKRYSVTDLFENPTLSKISKIILNKTSGSKILEPLNKVENSKMTIIGFPFAGGEPFIYKDEADLFTDCQFFAIKYNREKKDNDISKVISDLCDEIQKNIQDPFIIQGQCLGSIPAILVAEECRKRGLPLKGLLVGSVIYSEKENELHNFNEPIVRLKKLGATIPNTDEDLNYFLENYTHDQNLYGREAYRYLFEKIVTDSFSQLQVPLFFVTGDKDPLTLTYEEDAKNYYRISNEVKINIIPDVGHYLLRDSYQELHEILNNYITEETNK